MLPSAADLQLLEAALPPFSRRTRSTQRQIDSIAHAERVARNALTKLDALSGERLAKAYRRAGRELRRNLRAIMAKYPGGKWNYSDAIRYRDLFRTFEDVSLRLDDLGSQTLRGLEDDLVGVFRNASGYSTYQLDISTPPNIGVSFTGPNEMQVRSILDQPFDGQRFSQAWGEVNNGMAAELQQELSQSMLQGESVRDAAKRIDGVLNHGYARAERIARSELIRASTLAKDAVMSQNADLVDPAHPKEWIVTDDGRLCVFCDRIVSSDDYRLAGPDGMFQLPNGRRVQGPPAHPNCRCTTAPRMLPWSELIDPSMAAPEGDIDMRMIRNPATGKNEIVSIPTYDAWTFEWTGQRAA